MKMSVHALAMETYVPALRTLSELLDKGVEHSKAKGTDAAALLKERLASDMFPLALQVQLACHHAKDGTARATGQEPPKIDTSELPFTELKALIEQTVQTLSTTSAKVFDGAEDRRIELQLQGSRVLEADGLQFLWRWSIPHFYFHVVTAYDILRHTGVQLGKRDYMSQITSGLIHQRASALKEIHLSHGATINARRRPPHRRPIALARSGATPPCFRRGEGVRTPRFASPAVI